MESPLGPLLMVSDGKALTGLYPATHRAPPDAAARGPADEAFFTGVRDQLLEYFAGRLRQFEVALAPVGSAFQQQVWAALRDIPFGATWSYGELASRLGLPRAARAVGLAVGRNPVSLVVPCHRVVGARGQLTGYAGGLPAKKWLLSHEQAVSQGEHVELTVMPHQMAEATLRVHARA